MDKVQIYECVMLGAGLFLSGLMNGKEKTGEHNWYDFFIALPFSLPIIGRVFGWW